jgi:acetoin utilization deacetylase AcuC-like enzyme
MSRTTGYVFDERCMWHDQGSISWSKWIEPGEHWENVDTKRRIHNLLNATGMISNLKQLKGRFATRDEIERFHTLSYVAAIKQQSDTTGATMAASDSELNFAKGGFEIALLGAGCVLAAVEALLIERSITNAYCLVRPPGHHAEANRGCGFCMFNNVVVAAHHARVITEQRVKRIAVIDYDVHHGNGTQDGFWNDENALLISLHQDSNYPIGTGRVSEVGGVKSPDGTSNSIINVPLPPGSGTGAYEYSFHRVVVPALRRFKPDLIFVSSGFDASFADPLGAMILGSDCYAFMTEEIMKVADGRSCCYVSVRRSVLSVCSYLLIF